MSERKHSFVCEVLLTSNLKAVGHSFQKIYDIPWSTAQTLRGGPKTATEWKCESGSDQPRECVDAKDAYKRKRI